MRGSLAIWCDPVDTDVEGHSPQIELHFNIWLDLPGSENVLDIGILFKEARPIRRLYLYIPAFVPLEQIEDLSPILHDSTTLSAVFNDTLTVGSETQQTYEAKRGKQIAFRVVRLNRTEHFERETITEKDGTQGTIIKFTEPLFRTMNSIGDYYVRLRVPLRGDIADLFTNDFDPNDRIFLSAFYRTDVIEFRVNERRNFGEHLRLRFPDMEMPTITAIHYFLVRDIGTELVQSHADFRKMRRLEPLLWNSYLQPLGRLDPEQMVIYHWRSGGETGKTVNDFIAFTLFRRPRPNIALYLLGILLLGVGGNVLHTLVMKRMGHFGFDEEGLSTQVIVLAAILFLLWCVYVVASRRSFIRQIRRGFQRLPAIRWFSRKSGGII